VILPTLPFTWLCWIGLFSFDIVTAEWYADTHSAIIWKYIRRIRDTFEEYNRLEEEISGLTDGSGEEAAQLKKEKRYLLRYVSQNQEDVEAFAEEASIAFSLSNAMFLLMWGCCAIFVLQLMFYVQNNGAGAFSADEAADRTPADEFNRFVGAMVILAFFTCQTFLLGLLGLKNNTRAFTEFRKVRLLYLNDIELNTAIKDFFGTRLYFNAWLDEHSINCKVVLGMRVTPGKVLKISAAVGTAMIGAATYMVSSLFGAVGGGGR